MPGVIEVLGILGSAQVTSDKHNAGRNPAGEDKT